MNYAKLLAHGVGSWLQYEQACGHSGLFSEKYMAQPIGHILSGRSRNRVLAEYTHPILSAGSSGPGRRPAIDFVVCDPYPQVKVGVESKWIGKTRVTIEDIVWDLIRLELLAHHQKAQCYFVLGGKRRNLDDLFDNPAFVHGSTNRQRKPLLRHDNNVIHTISIGPIDKRKLGMLDPFFDRYPDLAFPFRIVSRRSAPFPEDQVINGYQVYVWEVRSISDRMTFRGGAMKTLYPLQPHKG
jgi:hypothetical protein